MGEKEVKKPIASIRLKCRKGIVDIAFWEGQRMALVKVDVPIRTSDQGTVTFENRFRGRVDVLELIRFWVELGKVLKDVGEQWFIDFKRAIELIESVIEEEKEEQ